MLVNKIFNGNVNQPPLTEIALVEKSTIEVEPVDSTPEESELSRDRVSDINSIFSRSLEEQGSFFLSQTPAKWFSFKRVGGQIRMCLSKSSLSEKNIIYIFHDVTFDKYLIGKTEQTFHGRMSQYSTKINGSDSSDSEFISAVRRRPSRFKVAILYRLKPAEDIDLIEDGFIQHYLRAGKQLYNQRKGGGGGRAKAAELPSFYAIPAVEGFLSPDKSYPVIRTERGLSVDASPGFKENIQRGRSLAKREGKPFGHIYRYKREREDQTVIRYVGMSGVVEKRVPQHCSNAKRHNSKFHRDLNKHPEQFGVNILPIEYIDPKSLTPEERENFIFFNKLGDVEDFLIEKARGHGRVYNSQGKGGGGPRASSLCQVLFP